MLAAGSAWSDGTETLGPPSLTVASGNGVYANGTGMLNQPGNIMLEVPAGATVEQVQIYGEGFMATDAPGDNTVAFAAAGGPGMSVVGTLIGGSTRFFNGAYVTGTGVGKLNNKPGGRIEFVFVDAGEPGYSDTAKMKVFDENNNLVLGVPGRGFGARACPAVGPAVLRAC